MQNSSGPKKPTPAATRECSFSGVLSSCFLVLKGGTDRGRVNPFLTLTQECWRVNTEERKEPLVSPGRRFAPGLPRPCFSTAVKNDDFITAGVERKAGLLRS